MLFEEHEVSWLRLCDGSAEPVLILWCAWDFDLEGTEDQVLLQAPGIEPDLAEIAGVVGWSAAVVDAQRRAGDRSATPGVWGAAAYQFGGSGE
nr:hypothetical protein [Mycolicibacterium goodii]